LPSARRRGKMAAIMATYAIGDIHGCFDTLKRLLARLRFDRRHDRLWLVGDLVNRGPRSLAVLRWAVEQEDRLTAVLGNHDLHLLGLAAGVEAGKRRDTLEEVLAAPDRDDLLAWLCHRPVFHREGGFAMVHAGLFPSWTLAEAERLARRVEAHLRGGGGPALFAALAGKSPERWRAKLTGEARDRAALAGFVKLRALSRTERLCADWNGPPDDAPGGCRPWFSLPGSWRGEATVIFGHWAAAGLRLAPGLAGLDTGCVWGQRLTALRLDDGTLFQEPR
jgi:bis(5'-nucleosyl)-tetraphosphatase (symmetrical)